MTAGGRVLEPPEDPTLDVALATPHYPGEHPIPRKSPGNEPHLTVAAGHASSAGG
jgi:hypothetical protein